MAHKPKLIEVALPLAAINAACAREKKSIRHWHPSTLHFWWARRPLAATRAVLWASLVDDPSGDKSLAAAEQTRDRDRLFGILERLVVWENSNDRQVLAEANAEIDRCFPGGPPAMLDPFGGGGAIPLEAQRLGLTTLSGDLNPVAVLIQKAMMETPPPFAGQPPVHPNFDTTLNPAGWTAERAIGLAADVAEYGRWMGDEAKGRIGALYPSPIGPAGSQLTPIAWFWARTVESPDPSWSGHVPLVASWILANKKNKPTVWVEPIVDRNAQSIRYEVRIGGLPSHPRTVNRGVGTCLATGATITGDYIKAEARAGRMAVELMAVVADSPAGRTYLPPTGRDSEAAAGVGMPGWKPAGRPLHKLINSVSPYGITEWWDLFSPRQLAALTTFSDLLGDVHHRVHHDATQRGMNSAGVRLRDGGDGASAYADAIVTYLAFVVDKCADFWAKASTWNKSLERMRSTFGRQTIAMTWDYAEVNPFSTSTGSWMLMVDWVRKAIEHLPAHTPAIVTQRDARTHLKHVVTQAEGADGGRVMVSTDPPYYDNISYADISDFFYVWLRRNLAEIWPDECATIGTPKADELIAHRYRAGSQEAAEKHFESGMAEFMRQLATYHTPEVPATIYYAYKATETRDGEIRSTGWDTFLQAVIDAGLQITATWPLRTEYADRQNAFQANALASSVVLTCRPRTKTADNTNRGDFLTALRAELPTAVNLLRSSNIAPVDLPQATIGPGIRIFSRYSKVVETDGTKMSVATALSIINDVLGEIDDGETSHLDHYSRVAIDWYGQYGYEPASSGDADTIARAKNTSVDGVCGSGIGTTRDGTFRLYTRDELKDNHPGWTPSSDAQVTAWEATQRLVAAHQRDKEEAIELLQALGGELSDSARALAYLLYDKAAAVGLNDDANVYNELINAWPDLSSKKDTQLYLNTGD